MLWGAGQTSVGQTGEERANPRVGLLRLEGRGDPSQGRVYWVEDWRGAGLLGSEGHVLPHTVAGGGRPWMA